MKETDPLNNLGGCGLFEFMFESVIPDTPHPDCKLNDLPTPEKIHEKTSKFRDNSDYYKGEIEGFEYGANWLIQQISK